MARRDPEAVRRAEAKRSKTAKRRASQYETTKRMRARHPERFRARRRVAYAVATGRLVRRPCEVCRTTSVQAHHHRGYVGVAVLDVRWLCAPHHREAHRPVTLAKAA